MSDKLKDSYTKYHSPTERLAVYEISALYKGKVIFKQYIPKKHKRLQIKIHNLCDSKGYTCDIAVYLGKDRQHASPCMTATHAAVSGINTWPKNVRQIL